MTPDSALYFQHYCGKSRARPPRGCSCSILEWLVIVWYLCPTRPSSGLPAYNVSPFVPGVFRVAASIHRFPSVISPSVVFTVSSQTFCLVITVFLCSPLDRFVAFAACVRCRIPPLRAPNHPFIHLHPSIHPSIHPSLPSNPSLHPSIHPSISIHPSTIPSHPPHPSLLHRSKEQPLQYFQSTFVEYP